MSQAAAEEEERLARVAGEAVLLDGMGDVLTAERIFELGSEERQTVEEDGQVKRVLVFSAVLQLAHDAENVALVLVLDMRVQPRGGREIDQLKPDAQILDAVTENIKRTVPGDLMGKLFEEMLLQLAGILLLQLLPLFGLGDADEADDILRDEAKGFIIVGAGSLAEAAQNIARKPRRIANGGGGARLGG